MWCSPGVPVFRETICRNNFPHRIASRENSKRVSLSYCVWFSLFWKSFVTENWDDFMICLASNFTKAWSQIVWGYICNKMPNTIQYSHQIKYFCILIWLSVKFVPRGPIDDVRLANRFTPNMWQAITYTRDDPVHSPCTCFLSNALIGQSYMACLKHVTVKHGNVNFR